jgi:hypothetical protein
MTCARFAALLAALAAPPAGAEAPGGAAQLALAHDLFAAGTAARDPILLMAAARLAAGVVLTPAERTPQTTGAGTADAGAAGPPGAAEMLAAARSAAGEDELILTLLDDIEAAAGRGGDGAAAVSAGRLTPGQADRWRLPFFGAVRGEVAVVGDGDAPLAVTVQDETGATLCRSAGAGDRMACAFVPAQNGYVEVEVRHAGGAGRNDYLLFTN